MKGCLIGAGILTALAAAVLFLALIFRKRLDRHIYGIILLCAVNAISLSVVFVLCMAFFLS